MTPPEQTPAPEQWMLEAAMAIRAGLGGGFYWEKRHEDTAAIIIARHAPTAPDLAKVRDAIKEALAIALGCQWTANNTDNNKAADRILTALAPFLSAPTLGGDAHVSRNDNPGQVTPVPTSDRAGPAASDRALLEEACEQASLLGHAQGVLHGLLMNAKGHLYPSQICAIEDAQKDMERLLEMNRARLAAQQSGDGRKE